MDITVAITNIQEHDEEYDALLAVVATAQVERDAENMRRAAQSPPLELLPIITPESYLKVNCDRAVASYAKQARERRVAQLASLTDSLPYVKRLEIARSVVEIATS